MSKLLNAEKNFDIISRRITICGKDAVLYFIDGFSQESIVEKMMEFMLSKTDEKLADNEEVFARSCVPYGEITVTNDEMQIAADILSGVLALYIDGFSSFILIDQRTYPQRVTSEPEKDKAFRGARDGFVETLVFNVALIRRRVRDPSLCVEVMKIGGKSKTDTAVLYTGASDKKLLEKIKKRLAEHAETDDFINQQTLSDYISPAHWYDPFPKVRYTERPDTAAAQLLEGDILVIADNSPSAMILPVTLFDLTEEANDYYFPLLTGVYLRLTRLFTILVTLILTPLWLGFVNTPEAVPSWLSFILPEPAPKVPYFLQLIILEIAIDGLKLAALNTPNMLTTSLSMIGAVVVGDFAVKSGWFSPQVMLYMAIVAIAAYSQPEYELGYALKFMRFILLAGSGLFGLYGFLGAFLLVMILLACSKTIDGKSYLYPFVPFKPKVMLQKLFRNKARK